MSDLETLNQYRQFALASEVVLPVIEDLRESALQEMLIKNRQADPTVMAYVHRVDALSAIVEEIKTKASLFEAKLAKQQKENKNV